MGGRVRWVPGCLGSWSSGLLFWGLIVAEGGSFDPRPGVLEQLDWWLEAPFPRLASISFRLTRIEVNTCIYIHTYIPTYIHTYVRTYIHIHIQSFKVGRVGDEELFGKLQVNVSLMFECSSQTGETPLRSRATAGTSSWIFLRFHLLPCPWMMPKRAGRLSRRSSTVGARRMASRQLPTWPSTS